MRFNSAFKGLKLLKTPGTGVLNNLNDPVLNVLRNVNAKMNTGERWYESLCNEINSLKMGTRGGLRRTLFTDVSESTLPQQVVDIYADDSSSKFLRNGSTIFLFSTTHCSLLRLIVRSGLDVPTFATRRLHACHHARAPSGGRWTCG